MLIDGAPRWWLEFITARLNLETPLPPDAAERRALLERAVRDLFGNEATADETAAFLADREADRARFAGKPPRSSPRPHAIHGLADSRPGEVPRDRSRSRRRKPPRGAGIACALKVSGDAHAVAQIRVPPVGVLAVR